MSLSKLNTAIAEISKIDLSEIVEQVILSKEDEVTSLNTDNQLYRGIDALGQSIQPEYTALTKKIKQRKGQPSDRVTLKDTGSFYDKFTLKTKKFPFEITSSDSKKDKLVEKYGEDVFGLNDDSKDKLVIKISNDVSKGLKDKIHDSLRPLL